MQSPANSIQCARGSCNMKLLRSILPVTAQETRLQPLYTAIQTLTRTLDNFITGGSSTQASVAKMSGTHPAGRLVYVGQSGEVTTDFTFGYNAVSMGNGNYAFRSAIAKPGSLLVPGKQYWLELATGSITQTPNASGSVQLLGTALTSSDLHFIYSPPTPI